ncbi:hypothetical protein [Streptomyces aureus]|uniref:Transposase n=1 Tax=Streptomyces aureus TaxID=193461 RepID=A0ABV4SWN2_9ACTN
MATLPANVRASFAMPDVRWGYGFLRVQLRHVHQPAQAITAFR